MGEAGVREEFFKGTFQASQIKEASAFRWLGEKRKVQERKEAGRKHRIRLVVVFILWILVLSAAGALVFGFDEILDKAGSALRFSWKVIAGTLGTAL